MASKDELIKSLQARIETLEAEAKVNKKTLDWSERNVEELEGLLNGMKADFSRIYPKFVDAVEYIGRMKSVHTAEELAKGAALAKLCLDEMKPAATKRAVCPMTLKIMGDCVDMFKVRCAPHFVEHPFVPINVAVPAKDPVTEAPKPKRDVRPKRSAFPVTAPRAATRLNFDEFMSDGNIIASAKRVEVNVIDRILETDQTVDIDDIVLCSGFKGM